MLDPKPHQLRGVAEVHRLRREGVRRIVLTSPTGMGKTWMSERLIRDELAAEGMPLIYTGRRLLLDQLRKDMEDVPHGVRAAGVMGNKWEPFQIASLPTDKRRLGSETWDEYPATLVIVDEGHLHTSAGDQVVLTRHVERGATVVYVTATPVGMGDVADRLVVAGTNKEGRECGMLVRARHYGPDEPALAKFRSLASLTEMSENDARAAMGQVSGRTPDRKIQALFGRVLEWFDKLNKKRKPTILFAPGVAESWWFAEQFLRHGITAAHIDGENVVINGVRYGSGPEERSMLREMSESNKVTVVCNRFVLREGVNYPWLAHGIFATVFDSLQSYLQAGGRLLRSHPSLRTVCVQDHGGNWWRHGSLNEDRHWRLECTNRILAGVREDTLRDKDADPEAKPEEREPVRCPACAAVCRGRACFECGFELGGLERFRPVAQQDGTLVRITGKMFPQRVVVREADTKKKWMNVFWRMRNAKERKTFNQAYAYFYHLHGYYPPRDLPKMPKDQWDWYFPIKDVGHGNLYPDPDYKPRAKKPKPKEKGLFDDDV